MSREFRIPAGKVKYDNWEMPDLTGVQRSINNRLEELKQDAPVEVVESVTEDAFSPPTLEELEKLRTEFEEEGKAEGLAKGLEEGRKTGFEAGKADGYEQGYQAGYSEGINAARDVIEAEIVKWQNLQEQIVQPLKVIDEDVELAIVELIKLISTGILRRELNLDRTEIRNIVREAINSLPNTKDRVNVRINPEDVSIVESACEKSLEDYRIIPDENITKGGCILDMKNSLVNSTIERRYQALVDMIIGEAYPQVSMKNSAGNNQPLGAGQFSNKSALEELQKLQRELQSSDFKSLVHKSLNLDNDDSLSKSLDSKSQDILPEQKIETATNLAANQLNDLDNLNNLSSTEDIESKFEPNLNNASAKTPSGVSQESLDNDFSDLDSAEFSKTDAFITTEKPTIELNENDVVPEILDNTANLQESSVAPANLIEETDDITELNLAEELNLEDSKVANDPHDEYADLEVDQATVSNWLDGEDNLSNLIDSEKQNRDRENVMKFPSERIKKDNSSSSIVEGSYLDSSNSTDKSLSIDDDIVDLSAFDDD